MPQATDFKSLVLPEAERSAFLEEIGAQVRPEYYQRIQAMTEAIPELLRLLQQEGMSLNRLRHLVFGVRTEKTDTLCPSTSPASPESARSKPKPKGHGRSRRSLSGVPERQTAPPAQARGGDANQRPTAY
jgi:hypothetical protein